MTTCILKFSNLKDLRLSLTMALYLEKLLVVLVRLYRVLASLVLELHWRRGDVGGRTPPLEEKVKIVVESREKFLGLVTRGVKSESEFGVGVTLEVGLHLFKNVKMVVERCEKKLG